MPVLPYRGRVPVQDEDGAAAGRVRALGTELRGLHDRIRDLLDDARLGLDVEVGTGLLTNDLVVRCRAVCTTLGAHHAVEDSTLFPWLRRTHPRLGAVADRLEQDHAMVATLLADLALAVSAGASTDVVLVHLDGLDAILQSHFRYEERELVPLLDAVVGEGPALPERFWVVG